METVGAKIYKTNLYLSIVIYCLLIIFSSFGEIIYTVYISLLKSFLFTLK